MPNAFRRADEATHGFDSRVCTIAHEHSRLCANVEVLMQVMSAIMRSSPYDLAGAVEWFTQTAARLEALPDTTYRWAPEGERRIGVNNRSWTDSPTVSPEAKQEVDCAWNEVPVLQRVPVTRPVLDAEGNPVLVPKLDIATGLPIRGKDGALTLVPKKQIVAWRVRLSKRPLTALEQARKLAGMRSRPFDLPEQTLARIAMCLPGFDGNRVKKARPLLDTEGLPVAVPKLSAEKMASVGMYSPPPPPTSLDTHLALRERVAKALDADPAFQKYLQSMFGTEDPRVRTIRGTRGKRAPAPVLAAAKTAVPSNVFWVRRA